MQLSFVVPCHAGGAPLIRRFLLSLVGQTAAPDTFEVVLGVDGGDAKGLGEKIQAASFPFPVVLVDSPRPRGDFPHRNHARNAAMKKARGWLVWIVDADFLWPSHAVEHAIAEHAKATADDRLISVTPILQALDEDPKVWLGMSEEWARTGDGYAQLMAKVRTRGDVYSGYEKHYREGPSRVASVGMIPEGFPCLRRDVALALGGFDERFVRWGGNKEEFTRRLGYLGKDLLHTMVLVSVRAYHQPHAADPTKNDHDIDRQINQQMFTDKKREILEGASWWQGQVAAVERVKAGKATADDIDPPGPRVGILAVANPRKGLFRDAEIIVEVLTNQNVRPGGRECGPVSVFAIDNVHAFSQAQETAKSTKGETLAEFAARQDVIICCEFLLIGAFTAALKAGKRVIYIPNADWCEHAGSPGAWVKAVRSLQSRWPKTFTVVAKTPKFGACLRDYKIACTDIPWTVTDPVVRDRTAPQTGPVTFFASLGNGGWKQRRAADVLALAWRRVKAAVGDEARLIVKTIEPLDSQADKAESQGEPRRAKAIRLLAKVADEVITAMWDREQLDAALRDAHVLLYPTRWDGYGLSLREALHAGLPAIVSDVWPMNEQVIDGQNGLLIDTETVGRCRLAPHAEPDPGSLAKMCVKLVRDRRLLAWLTAGEPGLLVAQQYAFAMRFRAMVLGEAPPRVAILGGPLDAGEDVRSERFYQEALRLHGYDVDYLEHSVPHSRRAEPIYDFGIVSKAPIEDVRRLRKEIRAPVLAWHHDLVDFKPARMAWFRELIEEVDLAAIPEDGLDRFRGSRAKVITLMPGCKHYSTRGIGLRSEYGPTVDARSVVFLGGCVGAKDERVGIVQALNKGVGISTYGDGWRPFVARAGGYVGGKRAQRVNERAGIALCVSRGGHDRYYTSNRLFNAAGAAAVPLVAAFPGLRDLYPVGTCKPFTGAEGAVTAAKSLLKSRKLGALRLAAQRHTFRHHTWADRIGVLLAAAKEHLDFASVPIARIAAPIHGSAKFGDMWEKRARKMGRRGVGHISWSNADLHQSTKDWWKKFHRHFASRLKRWDVRILDYGCGWGRFSQLLAAIPGKSVVGVDISPTMLRMARESRQHMQDFTGDLTFQLIEGGKPLPFPDNAFDALFTCTVLQHVPDAEFDPLCQELLRVLKPDGVVFLFENTHKRGRRTSDEGHVVFRTSLEYRMAFQGVNVIDSWCINGEIHSVLAGRRTR